MIVLLILAGISIAMLTGENGIVTKAGEAKNKTKNAEAKEKLQIEVLGSYDNDRKLDINNLKSNIIEHISGAIVEGDTFPITVTVDGKTFTVDANGNIELVASNPVVDEGIKAEDIVKEPATFYGSEVRGYTVNATAPEAVKNAVTTWRIFYAGKEPSGTEDNIYLIADDYIPYTAVPDGKNGSKIFYYGDEYKLSFKDVYIDYEGSSCILEQTEGKDNSLAKVWLNKYFNYTPDSGGTYPNRTSKNINMKVVAYMMDTNQWSSYVGERAKYAIGGPPIEMYFTSYRESHEGSSISCDVNGTIGYKLFLPELVSNEYNEIYVKSSNTSNAMWLVGPSDYSSNNTVFVRSNGTIDNASYKDDLGIRPLICLKSGVQLEKVSDGVYSIKEE